MTMPNPRGNGRYPFGRSATARPPTTPTDGPAQLFVLGVYPSALHVRWEPPTWARDRLGIGNVGALAVDDEPTVFWDGADAKDRVDAWKRAVGFVDGDESDGWGHVRSASNGTSGRAVIEQVLTPLGVSAASTWFTDAVDRFFVKRAGASDRRQQADVIELHYAPFAAAVGLEPVDLPTRPSANQLVSLAVSDHGERLRGELQAARPSTVVTLGEEARRVLAALADVRGGPALPLDRQRFAGHDEAYGEVGEVRLGTLTATCHALVHPGQRQPFWRQLHERWQERIERGDR